MSGFPFLKSFKGFQVSREGELELQDVFLDRVIVEREIEENIGFERKLEIPLSRWLLWGVYAVFLVVMTVFFGRTFYMQVFASDELQIKAEQNAVRSSPLGSDRGVVYDRFGKQLVFNKPSFDFVCDQRDLPEERFERERVLRTAAAVLGIPFEDIKAALEATKEARVLLAENLSHEHLIQLEARAPELPGCEVQKNTIREYAQNLTLAHLLGYTAKISSEELRQNPDYFVTDQIGKTGLEKTYEKELRGNPGRVLVEKDALGNVVQEKGEIASEPGNSLSLWLDFELQQKIEESLGATLDRIGAKKGVGIALDPNTGGVLSLVSIPGFDNNLFARGITRAEYQSITADPLNPLFNRAISGTYPTGSTIKPFVASAALEENVIAPNKEILTHGYIDVPNQYDPEIVYRFLDNANHGAVDMKDAIAVSSNVYFYTIGGGFGDQQGLGPRRIKEYLLRFGWGAQTGVDLSGESNGLVPDPEWKQRVKGEGWWDGDTYNFSIGQGNLLATPLQVANSFVAVANGGTLYKPQMVKEVLDPAGESRQIAPQEIRNGIIEEENLEVVRDGMRQAVKWGSSVLLNQLPVSSAAKTGTAQTGREDAEGRDYLYSWVTVFAPYENPEIVLTIMVEEAKEGSFAVLPVAKEVLEWYFTR